MDEKRLEEERINRPFDPDRKTTLGVWTTKGVQKKLNEIAAERGKALSTHLRELLEGYANGYWTDQSNPESGDVSKLQDRINELETEKADLNRSLIDAERRIKSLEATVELQAVPTTLEKTETDHIWNQLDEINEKLLKLAEPDKFGTGDLQEKLFFAAGILEAMGYESTAHTLREVFRIVGILGDYIAWMEARRS